jgi:hypothetical protein
MRLWAVVLSLAALACAAPAVAQQKYQCWTDKNGQRMCGDRVPPEYAGQKREVIKDGRVVDTVRAAKTPGEIAEEKRKKQAAEDAQRQADYDRQLLETYRSDKDIASMRDERVALLDSRIASIEKNAANTDKTLTDLKARAEKLTAEGKPVDERLAKQIKQFERDQKTNLKSLERNRNERAEIERKFNTDLARYQELRGIKPAAAATPATPAAGTPAAPAAGGAAPAAQPAQPASPPTAKN